MRGSVLILTLFIMAAMSILLITAFSIADSHFIITRNNNLHQEVYYLAESGMGFAENELYNIIVRVHEECMNEFQFNPLQHPMYSLQESATIHIENSLGPKLNRNLIDMKLLTDFPVPDIPNLHTDSKIDIRIRFTDVYQNPSRLFISSRADIGKIRRRIDSEIHINKVGNIYDSYLLNKSMFIGKDLYVKNGNLESYGSIYVQGGLHGSNNSILHLHELATVRDAINLTNGCRAFFHEDIICQGLYVAGKAPSIANCLKDTYSYDMIRARGSDSIIKVDGKLYVNPEETSLSAGVSALDGGNIQLGDEVFINGTLGYETNSKYLFGMEHIPIENNIYHSSESIGGENNNFYFPDNIPEYAYEFFTPDFVHLTKKEQGEIVHTYINTPPDSEEDLNQYLQHLEEVNLTNIQLTASPISGYTSGFIYANDRIIEPLHIPESETFFKGILKKMKLETSWNYNYQLNPSISVPLYNVSPEENSFSILDIDQPIVYIIPEVKDIILPSGNYEGILITNGSIYIPPGADIVFKGLIIAGEDLMVEGCLTVQEDRELILDLLNSEDETLRKFFRIEREKPLFEVISCKEVSYNAQW